MYSQYLSDSKIQSLVDGTAVLNKMVLVEIALAKVQAKQGIIPKEASKEITKKLKHFAPPVEDLAQGTLQNGIPTISLLALAKKNLSAPTKDYLHFGATSQDIIDTATILVIKDVVKEFENRLLKIIKKLTSLSRKHEQTYMVARTRTQQAIPMSFGLKVHNWVQPLQRHLDRCKEMKSRLLVVQFGGAGGNLAALDDRGWETAQLLANELKLNFSGIWHNQRDNIAEFSNWMSLVAGSFGKMAQDILLLSQTEIGAIEEQKKGGGKSSTMPHKNNPVLSEAIVALARFSIQLSANNTNAMLHAHERDTSAWALEWLTLPQMMISIGTILNHSWIISKNIQVNKKRMQANLEMLNGLIFSEQATFILCQFMTKKEAKVKVNQACQLVEDKGIHLAEALKRVLPDMTIAWKEVLQAKNYQGITNQILN